MKNTKKRVEAEKLLRRLGKRFKTLAENVVLYEMLNELEYRWTSELGKWETFDEWFERKPKVTGIIRVRVIAEPDDLDCALGTIRTGLELQGFTITAESAPYTSGNHPKYKGQTALRVYITAQRTILGKYGQK